MQAQQLSILENGKFYWFSFVESNEALVSDSPGTVSISGTYEVGETLTATVTDADEIDQQKIKYQLILSLENTVTLEIRLTCSLVWHLLKENEQLLPHEKVNYKFIENNYLKFKFI